MWKSHKQVTDKKEWIMLWTSDEEVKSHEQIVNKQTWKQFSAFWKKGLLAKKNSAENAQFIGKKCKILE